MFNQEPVLPLRAYSYTAKHLCLCRIWSSDTMFVSRKVFGKAGYRVAVIARNADHLKATASQIQTEGGEVRDYLLSLSFTLILIASTGCRFPSGCLQCCVSDVCLQIHFQSLARLHSPRRSLECRLWCLEAIPSNHGRRSWRSSRDKRPSGLHVLSTCHHGFQRKRS